MAKAVISETLRASRHDVIIVGVFPAGSDPVIGEWIDANFNYKEFSRAAEKVAKACSWDLSSYLRQPHALDTKPPGSPDHTEIAPDDY